VGRWEGRKVGRWEGRKVGRVGKWEGGKVGKWESGKVGKWVALPGQLRRGPRSAPLQQAHAADEKRGHGVEAASCRFVGKWWGGGKVGRWEGRKVGRWEGRKVGRWEGRKVGKWVALPGQLRRGPRSAPLQQAHAADEKRGLGVEAASCRFVRKRWEGWKGGKVGKWEGRKVGRSESGKVGKLESGSPSPANSAEGSGARRFSKRMRRTRNGAMA
jgi:hypothetical protein